MFRATEPLASFLNEPLELNTLGFFLITSAVNWFICCAVKPFFIFEFNNCWVTISLTAEWPFWAAAFSTFLGSMPLKWVSLSFWARYQPSGDLLLYVPVDFLEPVDLVEWCAATPCEPLPSFFPVLPAPLPSSSFVVFLDFPSSLFTLSLFESSTLSLSFAGSVPCFSFNNFSHISSKFPLWCTVPSLLTASYLPFPSDVIFQSGYIFCKSANLSPLFAWAVGCAIAVLSAPNGLKQPMFIPKPPPNMLPPNIPDVIPPPNKPPNNPDIKPQNPLGPFLMVMFVVSE